MWNGCITENINFIKEYYIIFQSGLNRHFTKEYTQMRNRREHHNQMSYSYTCFKIANVKTDHADSWQDTRESGTLITLLLELTIPLKYVNIY